MKTLLFISACLLAVGTLCGQRITPEQQKAIFDHSDFFLLNNINLANYGFENEPLNVALNAALQAKIRESKKRTAGVIFLSLGLAYTVAGIASHKKDSGSIGDSATNALSGLLIGIGVVGAGVSVPLLLGASKKKAEKEKALKIARGLVRG